MQTGYIVFFLISLVFSDECCTGNYRKKREGRQQDVEHTHYRVVEGEIFMMPCLQGVNEEVVWSRTDDARGGNEHPSFDCGRKIPAEAKHTGKYTCLNDSKLSLQLEVVDRNSVECFSPDESSVYLTVGIGGTVDCPDLNCSDNTNIVWYKGKRAMSEERRDLCEKNGQLHLCQVKREDDNVFFCDRQITEGGVNWTFRRAVNVTIVKEDFYKPTEAPSIKFPNVNTTEEVELGQSHTLTCEVEVPFERNFSPKVWWYMHRGGNMENRTPLPLETPQRKGNPLDGFTITQRAIIEEVRSQHLNNTYTCIASNTGGNHSVTIKLKKKIKVTWHWSLAGYLSGSLLLVVGLGIVLHVKWLEVQIIYRSYFQHGKQDGDEKEFDVFLSYEWSPPSRPDTDEEVCLPSKDLLNAEGGNATQQPLDVLLQVLERQWGYRLCLLERDVLPGGVYTNDVVLAIQRSQMLICLLSADYLSCSNAVYVLESGVQALLQKSTLKLLLIWINKASASLVQPDPPLPTLVQRALRVLPSLEWTSGKPARSFWKSLRKAMPDHTNRVRLVSLT